MYERIVDKQEPVVSQGFYKVTIVIANPAFFAG
jgi:hypothetical protein